MNKGDLMNQVYRSDLTKRATLVMFYLINRADKEMTCFPGIKTIARECGMSSRTVQRALNDLEEAGFVKKESRYHEQGGQRSNLYTLLISEEMDVEGDSNITFDTYAKKNQNSLEEIELSDDVDRTNKYTYELNHNDKVHNEFRKRSNIIKFEVTKTQRLHQYCHGG